LRNGPLGAKDPENTKGYLPEQIAVLPRGVPSVTTLQPPSMSRCTQTETEDGTTGTVRQGAAHEPRAYGPRQQPAEKEVGGHPQPRHKMRILVIRGAVRSSSQGTSPTWRPAGRARPRWGTARQRSGSRDALPLKGVDTQKISISSQYSTTSTRFTVASCYLLLGCGDMSHPFPGCGPGART